MKRHQYYTVPLFFIPWLTTLLDPHLGFFVTAAIVTLHYKTKPVILHNLHKLLLAKEIKCTYCTRS